MVCIKCLTEKGVERFEFRKDLNKYRTTCKDCRNLREKIKRSAPRPLKPLVEAGFENCTKCLIIKPLACFSYRKDTRKYRQQCIECLKKQDFEYRLKNRERRRQAAVFYRKQNPIKAKESNRKNYLKHKDARLEANRTYYTKNKYKILKKNQEYSKLKRKEDPTFRLIINLRARLRSALKGSYKSGSAIRDLGCTIEKFKKYMEQKFQPGMTWDNYGYKTWHIDHIVPLCKFDLTNRDEILKACHYTNLQPLWAKENMSKNGKLKG